MVNGLREITSQVWASYLDPEGLNPLIDADGPGRPDMVASVSISGVWQGHVVVACSQGAARNAAAAFLAMDSAEVTADDIADVLGELANIVGGNVKSMLPAVCFVSLPTVIIPAADSTTRWPGAVQICELASTWLDESISISMWQSKSERDEVPST